MKYVLSILLVTVCSVHAASYSFDPKESVCRSISKLLTTDIIIDSPQHSSIRRLSSNVHPAVDVTGDSPLKRTESFKRYVPYIPGIRIVYSVGYGFVKAESGLGYRVK